MMTNKMHSMTSRLVNLTSSFSSFSQVHAAAVANGSHTYVDPETGYDVFSELFHQKRGKCCGKACRHCPFGHLRATPRERKAITAESGISQRPTLLKLSRKLPERTDVLLWSGSASSYYLLNAIIDEKELSDRPLLLTMFEKDTGMLPMRDVSLHQVMEQLLCLPQLNLLAVPIPSSKRDSFMIDSAALLQSSLDYFKEAHNCSITSITTGSHHPIDIASSHAIQFPLKYMKKDEVNEKVEDIISGSVNTHSIRKPRVPRNTHALKTPNKLTLMNGTSFVNFSLFGM